jgi:checkpoint serine/threonine-protein kinase
MGKDDLIDFDIIEASKENIQSLPSGRSAKALAHTLSPLPTPSAAQDGNEAARLEFEKELANISESDDPLDIYDRYVKWTLDAYPSAQATPQSRLLPLLERATKEFRSSTHYKNDPRYLKLWLHYIRLFSDAPREHFAFLASNNIGDELALFYEEFAAWLENHGRWLQAEEVYKLGLEREAQPVKRLHRKYSEFEQRLANRPQEADEPRSPALPAVRPALAAKVDPFASASSDPQKQSRSQPSGVSASKSSRPKLAIFSDSDAPQNPGVGGSTKGWDSIGTMKERKKENTIEPTPWAGATVKTTKTNTGMQKMAIFRDQVSPSFFILPLTPYLQ